VLYDPGRVSGAVAITHAYWCLPAGARGRPLLYECHGARSLHFRYGLSVDLSTLRHGRCLARRKTGFPSAGWALMGRESHPLDECGFVWTHAPFLHGHYSASSVRYGPLRLPLRTCPLHGDTAYRVRRSQSIPEMAPQGSHCWGRDGPLLFPRWLSHRSTPPTPQGSSGLHSQVLHPFHGLRRLHPGSAPCWPLAGEFIPTRQASLHATDR